MSAAFRTYPVLTTGPAQYERNAPSARWVTTGGCVTFAARHRPGRPREQAGLEAIAAAYNAAAASGTPARAVRDQFTHYGRRTIAARIARARQVGLITTPAPRGGRPRKPRQQAC